LDDTIYVFYLFEWQIKNLLEKSTATKML